MSVRKAHNSGRNHIRNVYDYYMGVIEEMSQEQINEITAASSANGEIAMPNSASGAPGAPGGAPLPPSFPVNAPGGPPRGAFPPPPNMVAGTNLPPPPGGFGAPNFRMPPPNVAGAFPPANNAMSPAPRHSDGYTPPGGTPSSVNHSAPRRYEGGDAPPPRRRYEGGDAPPPRRDRHEPPPGMGRRW
ncbi:hypothetical protein N7532_011838 [Penicillium argentinense]|uniref:U1-C C2H2-type zinc finger domain-containing protein n=1 Tax=Penicillium argentinense TaxID=1131581 RepID=A0A9W9EJC1_9EURO|nr:uncharacterized protein N7532_011838 [Penicillium argentinense]KAJ5082795.1 hypothetical protein N7532_011838 [Penicillium argentinense]